MVAVLPSSPTLVRKRSAIVCESLAIPKRARYGRASASRVWQRAYQRNTTEREGRLAKILVHVTHGPEHPTRAALRFLVGRAAAEQGHEVTLFLAGDAVQLVRAEVLDSLSGLGTGSLRESYDALVVAGARFYLSGMSSKARGVGEAELQGLNAEMAMPTKLVELSLEHDRMFTY